MTEWVEADPVGQSDIASRLGVATVTVQKWRERHPGFPAPRWTVSGRPVWEWDEVQEWAGNLRPVGRPRS